VKPIALHWSRSKPNFGDALSPLVCERIAGRPVVWAPPERCDVIAIGSLLQRLKERPWSRRVHVWGTGFIAPQRARRSRHHYHAVRGPLSAGLVDGIDPAVVLGDPGLLVDRLVEGRPLPSRRCACLVIPHYKDRDLPALRAAVDGLSHVEVADVFTPPLELLDRIRAADCVLASAMHGLIAADALGVPNAWVGVSNALRGGDFKFRDYYGAFGLEPQCRPLTRALVQDPAAAVAGWVRPGLDDLRRRLVERFPVSF